VEDITRESVEMRHCLFENHLMEIAHGRMFAFSITESGEARATLSIKKMKTGSEHRTWKESNADFTRV
jgi:hypothetical protein